MQSLFGVPVSPGYAEGAAVVFDQTATAPIPRYAIASKEVDDEISRLHEALKRACRDLEHLEGRVKAELGDQHSSIFAAHLALLNDTHFTGRVECHIQDRRINAEQSLEEVVWDISQELAASEWVYMRERAQDIRDVATHLLRQLGRNDTAVTPLPPHSVVVARELLPSETFDLDRAHVAAIVTEKGGKNGHGAILARALGIPAVTAVSDACRRIISGSRVLVDGQTGRVTLMPTTRAAGTFTALKQDYDTRTLAEAEAERLECVTLDGTRVSLLANINRSNEAALVAPHHLDGVGLFRTEFIYMDALEPPDCEHQAAVYRQALEALGEAPLVVRTLDLGGDKIPPFLPCHREANSSFGLRGLRLALARPELFMPQLQALAKTAEGNDLRVLFPMVLGPGDLRQAITQFERAAEVMKVPRLPPLGAMIETPSALFALPEILSLVDFVSLGTNDLTQFMLAADRDTTEPLNSYSVLHPSVLRAIRQVVKECQASRCRLCVCGEAAGEPNIACLLVGLGIRELSMSPLRAAAVRFRLRSVKAADLQNMAEKALAAEETREVREMLSALG